LGPYLDEMYHWFGFNGFASGLVLINLIETRMKKSEPLEMK
jgi:hypothetical protein